MNLYNDNDPKVCAWVEGLVTAGLIPPGDVICKSITEISSDECRKYAQCHFFCGIAGWSVALALADWPADKPVWTGSCPCQPFSSAGRGKGAHDERHLWPAFYSLIRECKPATVFGEQVASPNGRLWLTAVRSDLEALEYAVGAADLCAAGVGAPHIRQRLYWVANTTNERQRLQLRPRAPQNLEAIRSREASGLGHTESPGRRERCEKSEGGGIGSASERMEQRTVCGGFWDDVEWLLCRDGKSRPVEPGLSPLAHGIPGGLVMLRGYGNAIDPYQAEVFIRAANYSGAESAAA